MRAASQRGGRQFLDQLGALVSKVEALKSKDPRELQAEECHHPSFRRCRNSERKAMAHEPRRFEPPAAVKVGSRAAA